MEMDTYVGEHGQVVYAGREDEGGAGAMKGWLTDVNVWQCG